MAGIEPASKKGESRASTCVAVCFNECSGSQQQDPSHFFAIDFAPLALRKDSGRYSAVWRPCCSRGNTAEGRAGLCCQCKIIICVSCFAAFYEASGASACSRKIQPPCRNQVIPTCQRSVPERTADIIVRNRRKSMVHTIFLNILESFLSNSIFRR